ncbi:MAG: EamA family transporter RarD [Candidatus Dormibacteraeota bacterium]|uniref:EamA family transporter RarD n=1 Tax=Candidatus Amunia macphersoniae TaxID=3127014 RepID=A0A934KDN8_9BACT|nr:EamA family transporter RarD [Candidatus Dormibacteraeota bacterium]
MSRTGRGLLSGAVAYLLWGLFPLYWPLLEPASPLEILAVRVVLSLVVVALLLALRHQLRALRRLSKSTVLRLCVAGAVIALNWGGYIWGVNNGHVVETSLGYFINPIVTVGLGVLLLHERLRRVQWAAVVLGAVAVIALSVDYGRPPWLALLLAFSFGTYGLIKKTVSATPPEGLLIEAAALTLPAITVLAVLAGTGTATWIGSAATPGHLLLLAAAGPVTAVPLLFFAAAASRLPLSTLGLLQYLAPVIQFAIGVLVRQEPMTPALLGGFGLVWLALAILTLDALHQRSGVRSRPAGLEVIDDGNGATIPARRHQLTAVAVSGVEVDDHRSVV